MCAQFNEDRKLAFDKKFIKGVGDCLVPEQFAMFILEVYATLDKALDNMAKFSGSLYQTSLYFRTEGTFKQSLKQEDFSKSAKSSLI